MAFISYLFFRLTELYRRYFVVPRLQKFFATLTEDAPFTTRDGLQFLLRPRDLIARDICLHGLYERHFVQFIRNHMRRKRTMLDVGANVGNHSVYLAAHFNKVLAFEPNPIALKYLSDNVKTNNRANLEVCSIGLGKEDAVLPFYVDQGDNLGMASFSPQNANEERVSKPDHLLQIRRGDAVVEEKTVEDIDFIKIDVEGFELDVLTGLQETIRRHRPMVTFEFHGHQQQQNQFEALKALFPGYRFYEPVFWMDASMGSLEKLRYRLRYGATPLMKEIITPEKRTYENIVAIAAQDQLKAVCFSPQIAGH